MTRRILLLLTILALSTAVFAQAPKPGAKKNPPATPEGMKAPKIKAANIMVMRPTSNEVQLPDDFRMAIYEKAIADLNKTARFAHVYRDGEKVADGTPDLVKVEIIVWGFKEGSARMRQVTTVAGATDIKVRVRATDSSGKELMDRNVEGSVHFFGENLRATDDLAGNISTLIAHNFETGRKPEKNQ
jgi:hypothetical protein